MGWTIIALGLILIGIGGFFTYYGQTLLNQNPPVNASLNKKEQGLILEPLQTKLLKTIYKYQSELGLTRLIINRKNGQVLFDEEEKRKKYDINLIRAVYDFPAPYESKAGEFENLILSLPDSLLRHIPETRMDSPFVIQITKEGIAYLKEE
ncbi:MAG: hypothetical protein A2W61_02300 [Deltaproteobacteria bacterium RIFCSPLOWO2_01_44_7]|nr:MAG: hypothetical protein A2712_05120 [Deltaproteobacteria bacterium RIFCSPHIGHO2_01_FULL_43_49]OGQ15937.1 MAG: hypothetical protein A3D22_07720 [Deltaproteobacteria bacterium RIFCSPHIGHO2_02_FULL_44_53]OGQ29459.1 MAG: hypothetical protein A3D98_00110 [Deltaproteobacteria bacterium RIFCSPHIGHO2_12_FULL_44_21]OGQ30991.1 MAG: hypothetical protein A2979_02110 [Deltaproteobacteria bacterium RIFCSPLOWO2_01_FULL_45_74]OGQ37794.1 MAG: hypothetical protein A2W61_02300 [Deltaproteobacteria bacterium 